MTFLPKNAYTGVPAIGWWHRERSLPEKRVHGCSIENVNKSVCFPSPRVILTKRSEEESPVYARDPSLKRRMTGARFKRTFPSKRVRGVTRKWLAAPRRAFPEKRVNGYSRKRKQGVFVPLPPKIVYAGLPAKGW